MKNYEHTVNFVRLQQNRIRKSYGETWVDDEGRRGTEPISNVQLINVLLSMQHWSAAEWLAEQEYLS